MAKVIVRTDKAPQPLAVSSQGVKSGGFIFVAGQGPFNPWFPEDPPAQQGAKLPIQPTGLKISIAAIAEA